MTKTPLAVHAYIQCTHACSYTTYMPLCKKQANSPAFLALQWRGCLYNTGHTLERWWGTGRSCYCSPLWNSCEACTNPCGCSYYCAHSPFLQFAPSLSCTLCLVLRVRVPPGTPLFSSFVPGWVLLIDSCYVIACNNENVFCSATCVHTNEIEFVYVYR
jgi:hypothetical protein